MFLWRNKKGINTKVFLVEKHFILQTSSLSGWKGGAHFCWNLADGVLASVKAIGFGAYACLSFSLLLFLSLALWHLLHPSFVICVVRVKWSDSTFCQIDSIYSYDFQKLPQICLSFIEIHEISLSTVLKHEILFIRFCEAYLCSYYSVMWNHPVRIVYIS